MTIDAVILLMKPQLLNKNDIGENGPIALYETTTKFISGTNQYMSF